jgi:hypothetical protein
VQPKLRINPPGDRFEQEADRVADRVALATPSSAAPGSEHISSTQGKMVQAKCATCDEEKNLQRKEIAGTPAKGLSMAENGVGTSGTGMSPETRSFMETQIGHRFGDVRIHHDAKAAESARGINARAYTAGRDIVFGAGEYAPETREGRRLLAHELTHVVQQRSAGGSMIQREPCEQSERFSGDLTWGHDIIQWDYVLKVNPYPGGKREYEIPGGSKTKSTTETSTTRTPDAENPELTGIDEPQSGQDLASTNSKSGFADIVDMRTQEIYELKPPTPQSQALGKQEVDRYVTLANLHCGGLWKAGTNYPGNGEKFRVVPDPTFPDIEWVATQTQVPGVVQFYPRYRRKVPEREPVRVPDPVADKIGEKVKTPRRHPKEVEKDRRKQRKPGDPIPIPVLDTQPVTVPQPVTEPTTVWEDLTRMVEQAWEGLKEFATWIGEHILEILAAIVAIVLIILAAIYLAPILAGALAVGCLLLLVGISLPAMGAPTTTTLAGIMPTIPTDGIAMDGEIPPLSEESKVHLDTLLRLTEELQFAMAQDARTTPAMNNAVSTFGESINKIYDGEIPNPSTGINGTDGTNNPEEEQTKNGENEVGKSDGADRKSEATTTPGTGTSHDSNSQTSTVTVVSVDPQAHPDAIPGSGTVSIAYYTTGTTVAKAGKMKEIAVWCEYEGPDGTIYRTNEPLMMAVTGTTKKSIIVDYYGETHRIVPDEFVTQHGFGVVVWKDRKGITVDVR